MGHVKERIDEMIKHERKISSLPLTLLEKLQIMKENNIIAILAFVEKEYRKMEGRYVQEFDIDLLS